MKEDPEKLPFDKAESDIDERSGIQIVWGTMDKDLSQDVRSSMLTGWLDEFKAESEPLFEQFYHVARSTETMQPGGREPGSIKKQFDEERRTIMASNDPAAHDDKESTRHFETAVSTH